MNKEELRSALNRAQIMQNIHPELKDCQLIEQLFLKLAEKGEMTNGAKSGPQKFPNRN